MALDMRTACERWGAEPAHESDAVICSYECTVCPNSSGEHVARPKRLDA